MRSRIKWCQMSICFALECETGLCARAMDPWLSAYMIVAFFWDKSSSRSNVRSYTASLVAFADAIYSASTDDIATVGCFLDDHDMTSPPTSKANPLVDQRSSGSWAQFESVQPTRSNSPFIRLPNTRFRSMVPLR